MVAFPSAQMAPDEFMERFLPQALEALRVPAALAALDECVAVRLRGPAGGDWRICLQAGALRVETGAIEDAVLTLLQSEDDWCGALWHGRGGPVGRYAARLFDPRAAERWEEIAALDAAALEPLRELEGLVAVVVTGGKGGDWRLELKFGRGALPDEPDTTISLSAEDADALGAGDIKPLEAFMAGRIRVEGDVGLVMRLQGAVMQLAGDLGPA